MRRSDGAQQAVFRPVQLHVRPTRGGVSQAGCGDGGPPSPGPLLPLRPVKSSDHDRSPALRGHGPGEAGDGGGGVQVRDGS